MVFDFMVGDINGYININVIICVDMDIQVFIRKCSFSRCIQVWQGKFFVIYFYIYFVVSFYSSFVYYKGYIVVEFFGFIESFKIGGVNFFFIFVESGCFYFESYIIIIDGFFEQFVLYNI